MYILIGSFKVKRGGHVNPSGRFLVETASKQECGWNHLRRMWRLTSSLSIVVSIQSHVRSRATGSSQPEMRPSMEAGRRKKIPHSREESLLCLRARFPLAARRNNKLGAPKKNTTHPPCFFFCLEVTFVYTTNENQCNRPPITCAI